MDIYFGYHQIVMYKPHKGKTSFMTEHANYLYMMPFGVKKVEEIYQMMENRIFKEEIGEPLEVYMDDMIVKSSNKGLHDKHIDRLFHRA